MKRIYSIILFLFITLQIFPEYEIYFIYNDRYYYQKLINPEEIQIEPFNALKYVDVSQSHRLLINYQQKSILNSLVYIGDTYQFNNIKLILKNINMYQITDNDTRISLSFSIAKYDNVILLSCVKFDKSKEITIIDKLASAFTVKMLLIKMTGKIEAEANTNKEEIKPTDVTIQAEYQKFLNDLKKLKNRELLDYITQFVKLNFELSPDRNITGEWVSPADLYFYKKGDYKSCAFFYYYTLKSLGLPVRAYLASFLEKKDQADIEKMSYAFRTRKPELIQEIEIEYKNVNARSNLLQFTDDYMNSKLKRPPDIFFYKPPDFEKATLLITVQINNRWIYTTGTNWTDAGIYTPERT